VAKPLIIESHQAIQTPFVSAKLVGNGKIPSFIAEYLYGSFERLGDLNTPGFDPVKKLPVYQPKSLQWLAAAQASNQIKSIEETSPKIEVAKGLKTSSSGAE
jgi:hypothetical protein